MKPASVTDVAKLAGVSLGTVSNALNRPDVVAPATLERVRQAIDELGFVRNDAARQLRSGKSRTIGLVVLDVANPFFIDVAAGVEEASVDLGLAVVLCNSAEDPDRESRYLSLLEEQRAFGILITPVLEKHPAIAGIRKRGTPIVLVDRASSRQQCSVSVDDVAGGEIAVQHLLGLRHRRIAFVGGSLSTRQVSDRLQGAQLAVAAAGRDPAGLVVIATEAPSVACGRVAGRQIAAMTSRKRPSAVFCANDLLALGLLQELTASGLSVPGDIAIVGYDDIDFAEAAAVPLTSVRQPRLELGRTAAELLIEEAEDNGDHRHRQVVFKPELVVRQSTVAPRS
jgi:LacI family transcriptional regulator